MVIDFTESSINENVDDILLSPNLFVTSNQTNYSHFNPYRYKLNWLAKFLIFTL